MKKKTHVRIAVKKWRYTWNVAYGNGPNGMCEKRGKGFICCRSQGHMGDHLFRDYKYEVTWPNKSW